MRCKKHLSDLSSGVGVCASCLREKLFAVILAQAKQQAEARVEEQGRKSESNPQVLVFPRSVSPYISRRKSDTDRRFYSTPQVGPNGAIVIQSEFVKKKKKSNRFSLFHHLFRSRSNKPDSDPDPDPRVSNSDPPANSSSSWFSTIFSGRRKKQNRTFSLDDESIGGKRINGRGMSPARCSDDEEEDPHCGSSGYSSESSSQGWKNTPLRRRNTAAPPCRRSRRNISGVNFCLSPLVRASPSSHRSRNLISPDVVFSGELRTPAKPHLPTATSFCKNRSRKLADFGRFNHNR